MPSLHCLTVSCFRFRFPRRTLPKTNTLTRLGKNSHVADSSTDTTMAQPLTAANKPASSTANEQVASSAAAGGSDTSTAVDMTALLSAQQLERLKTVRVGDLLFILKATAQADDDYDDDDDDESEHSGEEDAEGEDEDDAEQNVAASSDQATNGDTASAASQEDEDDNENEDSHSDPDSNDTIGRAAAIPTPPRMFIVTAITHSDKGDISDVEVQHLSYSKVANTDITHCYQVYGNDVVHRHPRECHGKKCHGAASITAILTDQYDFPLTGPQGDYVRRSDPDIATNPHRLCISSCTQGWLTDRTIVNSLIANHNSPVLAWNGGDVQEIDLQRAVCPVVRIQSSFCSTH